MNHGRAEHFNDWSSWLAFWGSLKMFIKYTINTFYNNLGFITAMFNKSQNVGSSATLHIIRCFLSSPADFRAI
jgi:hypothetical protein